MEPRPPRPRSSRQFEPATSPGVPGIGDRLYPAGTEAPYYPGSEPYAPGIAAEPPLLPRQQRRQRRALRGIGLTLVVIALIAALGWFLRDTILGVINGPPPPPTSVVANTDPNVAAPGTPEAALTTAALPNALATVTPTAVVASAATAEAPPDGASEEVAIDTEPAEPDRDISSQTQPLLAFLPTQEQVPAGLILADEAERSEAEVVSALGGTEEAAQLLDDWGWSGNAFRDFVLPEDVEVPAEGTTFLNVSVHRFADAESAANALVVFSDQVIVSQSLDRLEPPAIGEGAILLVGAPDGIPLTILYVQDGPIMYRIGGSSNNAEGDPTPGVLDVAQAIISSPVAEGEG